MNNIEKFNNIKNSLIEAFKDIESKYNVKINLGNMRYTDDDIKCSMHIVNDNTSAEQIEFNKTCSYYGVDPDKYGFEFKVRGQLYQLIGFSKHFCKKPIILKRVSDSKIMRFQFNRNMQFTFLEYKIANFIF